MFLRNMYMPHLKSLPHLFLKIYPLKCFFSSSKKRSKIHIILVCKLYIYRAIDLKLGMLVYIVTQHVHVHFQVSIALHCENILILYHKSSKKFIALVVCKIHILQLNGLKFLENVYFNKALLKI